MITLREKVVAEFVGTFVLCFFGLAPTAANVLNDSSYGDLWCTFAWWYSVMLGIIISDKISGAHLNPAVSFSFYINKDEPFTLIELITYTLSQFLGCYIAAVLLCVLYWYNFEDGHSGKTLTTSAIFVTYPKDNIHHHWQAFIGEIMGTSMLIVTIYCYITKIHKYHSNTIIKAFIIGCTVFVIIQSFSGVAGPSLNPARDFGPRLFLSMSGWGSTVYSAYDYYFWIPIIGPYCGSIVGTLLFHLIFKKSFHSIQQKRAVNSFSVNDNKTINQHATITSHLITSDTSMNS